MNHTLQLGQLVVNILKNQVVQNRQFCIFYAILLCKTIILKGHGIFLVFFRLYEKTTT